MKNRNSICNNKELEEATRWFLAEDGYVSKCLLDEQGNQYIVRLHEMIYELSGRKVPHDCEIYHINGDKLNNLEENLATRKIIRN